MLTFIVKVSSKLWEGIFFNWKEKSGGWNMISKPQNLWKADYRKTLLTPNHDPTYNKHYFVDIFFVSFC